MIHRSLVNQAHRTASTAASGTGRHPRPQRANLGSPGRTTAQPQKMLEGLARARAAGTLRRPRSAVLSVEDCRAKGVEIVECGGPLSPEERETVLSYTEAERTVEVTTGDFKLQRKLERAGVVPDVVNTFGAAVSVRLYHLPLRRLGINVKGR